MLCVFTEVRASPIEGLGCFADEPIPRGRKVWQFHPSVDMVEAASEINDLPAAACRAWRRYGFYSGEGLAILCGDDARFINHSVAPNIGARPGEDPEIDFALVDIPAGAELLCDYHKLGDGPWHGLCRAFLAEAQV